MGFMKPTLSALQKILRYDPDTGEFWWKESRSGRRMDQPAGTISNGYRRIWIDGVNYSGHQLAWLFVRGRWPPHHLDHADQDRSNNRIGNLRPTNYARNRMNTGPNRNSTSGFRGVTFYKRQTRKPWGASLKVNGQPIYLGVYETREEAAHAYDRKAREVYGEHAHVNFP